MITLIYTQGFEINIEDFYEPICDKQDMPAEELQVQWTKQRLTKD